MPAILPEIKEFLITEDDDVADDDEDDDVDDFDIFGDWRSVNFTGAK